MRAMGAGIRAMALLMAAPAMALAQARENDWIADQVRSTGAKYYVLATVVVILAAVLMAAALLRRARR